MFDPSKLNLDLDEKNKVSKINTKEEIKAELEKVEQVFDNKDILKEDTQKEKENLEQEEKDIL
jgi:hypothetical protein